MKPRKSKKILVTGTSRGIGAAVSTALRERGDGVIGLSRSARTADPDHVSVDFADRDSIRACLKRMKSPHGADLTFDGVVLNAGIAILEPLESVERVVHQLQVNALGHYELFMLLYQEKMLNDSLCNIVNIISKRSFEADPKQIGYCASKAVQHMLFSGLAKSLGKENILINHLIPGPVNTSMNPIKEDESEFIDPHKEPESVATSVLFLLDQPKTGPIDRVMDLSRR